MGIAFAHQYRFAAAESVEKEKVPKAISILMLAGIVSAFLGITLANYTKNLIPVIIYILALTFCLLHLLLCQQYFYIFYKNNEKNKNRF